MAQTREPVTPVLAKVPVDSLIGINTQKLPNNLQGQHLIITSGTLSRPDSQNELRGDAHGEDPLAPGTTFPVLQLGLSEPPVSSTKGTMVWDILKADSLHILPEKSVCFL